MIISKEKQGEVLSILKNLTNTTFLRELFQSTLDYDYVGESLPLRILPESIRDNTFELPTLFATGGNNNDFHVIHTQLKGESLLRGIERQAINSLIKEHPYSLFIFSNEEQNLWHFVNVPLPPDDQKRRIFRRITVNREERLRTASERISMLSLENLSPGLFGVAPLEIQTLHDEAFNVETVTKDFFNKYKTAYEILQSDLFKQTKQKTWAHDYALQFLNRCMFLYFIQRKKWLGNNTEFLNFFWETYKGNSSEKDTFFSKWLNVLFFEAFNNRKNLLNSTGRAYLPEPVRQILWRAPYLNGGLFSENDLDTVSYDFNITDNRFEQIFNFLENYNFTIAEDSPLDQEVAVDPEMIGKVYESLVNVSTEVDARGEAGIFYTPRTEIDLMCRLSLVDNLSNHLGKQHKNLLYELVFALEPQEKEEADANVTNAGLWQQIDDRLRETTVVDPACGSGSFLVGMLYVLDDLRCRADSQLKKSENAFDRKKNIIGNNLYGVDVKDWAAHIAELRMWLALVIDAQFTTEEFMIMDEPLLPHFSFKIRTGDALVQEIGGLELNNLRSLRGQVSTSIKSRITSLKNEKIKFYNNDPNCRFKDKRSLEHEELKVFRDLLYDRYVFLEKEKSRLKNIIESPTAKSVNLFTGEVELRAEQRSLKEIEYHRQLAEGQVNLEKVATAREKLKDKDNIPFVWDISFVEIFSDERNGFDIVIGNPPYVRQEAIADPHLERDQVTPENKKIYKGKLQRAVYQAFPHFFGYDERKDSVLHKLDAKSDLYIYFYFLTLQHLNPHGTFCFITSNSWLDVGYGADLQEFLLKRCRVRMIIDNSAKRSFESADVNTVIALITAPTRQMPESDDTNPMLDEITRFVMFQTGFENVLSPIVFEEIEEADDRNKTLEYRVFPITQRDLLKDGMNVSEDESEEIDKPKKAPLVKISKYIGNKWGGKYLRAPDIYWTILERGKSKFVQLSNIAKIRRGITSGANEFFLLDEVTQGNWQIEKEFLKPIIKSPRECRGLVVKAEDFKYKIFMCHKDRKELKGTNALEYIKWGEIDSEWIDKKTRRPNPPYLRPSCIGRRNWYDVGQRKKAKVNVNYLVDKVMRFFVKHDGFFVSDNFQEIHCKDEEIYQITAATNSTIFQLFANVIGRANFGDGLMKIQTYEVETMLLVKPQLLSQVECKRILEEGKTFNLESTERRNLDTIIFDSFNLTKGEREAVYDAAIRLVEDRLQKASSFKNPSDKKISKRLEAVERTQGAWQGIPDFEFDEM